jgi:hypothetical protein
MLGQIDVNFNSKGKFSMTESEEILKMNHSMLIDLHHSLTSMQTINMEMMGLLSRLHILQVFGFFLFSMSVLLNLFAIKSLGVKDLKGKVYLVVTSSVLIFGLKQLIWLDVKALYTYVNFSGGLNALAIGKHYFGVYMLGVLCIAAGFMASGFYFFKAEPRSR